MVRCWAGLVPVPGDNMERWPSGRRRSPAKRVGGLRLLEGSNPSLSARLLAVRVLLGLERFDEVCAGRGLRFLMPTNWPAVAVREGSLRGAWWGRQDGSNPSLSASDCGAVSPVSRRGLSPQQVAWLLLLRPSSGTRRTGLLQIRGRLQRE